MENDLTTLWNKVLGEIKKNVSSPIFLMFFKNSSLDSLEENKAIIAAPSIMIIDLLQKRFYQEIKRALDEHAKKDLSLSFVVKAGSQLESKGPPGPLFVTEEKPAPLVVGHLPRVRSDFTFQNFAVSSSNQVAWVSATTVANKIGQAYNPLFLYGPVGVGKTHLMHAIANQVYQRQPDKKIIYITSEEFTNEVVEAIRSNDTARMKRRFRSAYLLLIDDIQFVEGKERVQEELFHTFNILIDNGSQIALSSDRPPHEIKKLEKRLSSRFAGGLTVDIEPPDFELKTAILLKKAEKYGHNLPIEVAKIIAENAEDTRSLEGFLLRVITQATTTGEEITPDLAKKCLGLLQEEKKAHIHADDIIKTVCDFYAIKPTQIKGVKREASLVKARQIAMYILKYELGLTYMEIGNMLGGRDHSTIMHGVEKMEKLVVNKAKVSEDILGITRQLHE